MLRLDQRQPAGPHVVDDVLGDRQRRGQTGGTDPPDAGVVLLLVDGDLVVAMLGGGTYAGVGRGDLLVDQVGQNASSGVEQAVETGRRGDGVTAAFDVLGRRAQEHVAVHRRRHQDALRPFGGDRQHNGGHEPAGQLVEDDELAPPGRDGELVVAEAPVEEVGTEPGRVDHPVGPDRSLGGVQQPLVTVAPDIGRPPRRGGARRRRRPLRWRTRCSCSTDR